MSIEANDPGLKQALETALGHPAPFDLEELGSLKGPLNINQAADISLLNHCHNLEQLTIHAANVSSLNALSGLKKLTTLRVTCTPIEDISAIATCTALEVIELMFTLVEDLNPLMNLPSLRSGNLIGNPWNETSYYELRPRLLESPTQRWQELPNIEFSDEFDWEITRNILDKGQRGCFAALDGREVLVRPGIVSIANQDCDFLLISGGGLGSKIYDSDFSVDRLFVQAFGDKGPDQPRSLFAYERPYTQGTADEARTWVISSGLPEETKNALLRFINRFPKQLFYKQKVKLLEDIEAKHRVKLPEWLRAIRQTLADVNYGKLVWVKFDEFDGWSPRSDEIDEIWYMVGLTGYANDEQRDLLINGALFPIGDWIETGRSTLAIKLDDPQNQQVYEYTEQDLWENLSDGFPVFESARVVFNSYAEMLGHIVALRLENGEIIEAIEE